MKKACPDSYKNTMPASYLVFSVSAKQHSIPSSSPVVLYARHLGTVSKPDDKGHEFDTNQYVTWLLIK